MNVASRSDGSQAGLLEGVRALLAAGLPPRETLKNVGRLISKTFQLDLVVFETRGCGRVAVAEERRLEDDLTLPFTLDRDQIGFHGSPIRVPFVVNDVTRARLPSDLAVELTVRRIRSLAVLAFGSDRMFRGRLECYRVSTFRRWRQEDVTLLQQVADLCNSYLEEAKAIPAEPAPKGAPDRPDYSRLAKYGNIVILQTDPDFIITEAVGSTETILGLANGALLQNRAIWETLIDPRDRAMLRRKIARMRLERAELQAEIRIIHQMSGVLRWMMLRAIPVFAKGGEFRGWEGFGIDITERRQAQEDLIAQNERLEALFEVARAVQGHADPAFVALRGLRAVIRATKSACGYAAFFNRRTNTFELAAAQGLSSRYLDGINEFLKGPSLVREATESRQGFLIDNLQEHPRAASDLARIEGLRSAIVMPLVTESSVFGAFVTFKREARRYTELDFDLISAAAVQIAGAVRQAEMFESEKRHSSAVEALYKISRELSKHRTPKEIAQHAFPVLQEEFGLKRMWFGVLNEQGTHIVGKAGFGPGMRRQIQEIQVELNLRHDFLDEAIRTQKPVIVKAGAEMECSGLNRIMQRLAPETFIVIPLVSLNQVVGVLALEPEVAGVFFSESRLQLLGSMANEMATVLMARRFESKMSEASKMRMAGLLASGVAHNFNNLLQAVLGQVALIEMNLPKGSPAIEFTKTISDAAQRGASLVAQLLNFSLPSPGSRMPVSVPSLLRGSEELYRSLIGRNIDLSIDLTAALPDVLADQSQVQQVITNLLANAKDAIAARGAGSGAVSISAQKVYLTSGEVDPELPPGTYVRVDIKDNGVGMNVEQQVRCFEPFFTTKNVDRSTGVGISGSGLGLSAAYSIMRQHDGIITVHSHPEDGSVFSVYLPVKEPAPQQKSPSPASTSSNMQSGVLVLGLEPSVIPFAASIFSSLGCASRSVFDGHQMADLVRRDDRWGFALIDLDRIGDEAAPLIAALSDLRPRIGIIGVSSAPKEWAGRISARDRVEILEKPLSVWSVDGAIARLKGTPSTLNGHHPNNTDTQADTSTVSRAGGQNG